MKTAGVINLLCGVAAVGLAVCLAREHRAASELDQANKGLRVQLSQVDALLADNQRLLALIPANSGRAAQSGQGADSASAMSEPAKELIRLRGEAEVLRQENKVIQSVLADTRQARAAAETAARSRTKPQPTQNSGSNPSGSQLEILRAVYGTEKFQTDVTDELRDRTRDGSLKTVASNNLKGDPEFGQTKHLTIEYSYGGATFTNQFTEGALVILPPENAQ